MDTLLYLLAHGLVKCVQAMPLRGVARLGRFCGGVAYWIDARHRRVALENLTRCFGREKSAPEIRALARENFKRLGENYGCAIKTSSMTWCELEKHLEVRGLENLRPSHDSERRSPIRRDQSEIDRTGSETGAPLVVGEQAKNGAGETRNVGPTERLTTTRRSGGSTSRVIAIGHFGNFEVCVRASHLLPEFQFAATYRALKQPGLNRLLIDMRSRSGCLFFERRQDGEALRAAMTSQRLLLGFFSDQHAGRGAAWIPFFGQVCATTAAPAVFALRYKVPLHMTICYRTSLAQWRIEFSDEIPTYQNGERRSSDDIMLDVNRAFEAAIRRDPANWFWVHKRWKPRPKSNDQ